MLEWKRKKLCSPLRRLLLGCFFLLLLFGVHRRLSEVFEELDGGRLACDAPEGGLLPSVDFPEGGRLLARDAPDGGGLAKELAPLELAVLPEGGRPTREDAPEGGRWLEP